MLKITIFYQSFGLILSKSNYSTVCDIMCVPFAMTENPFNFEPTNKMNQNNRMIIVEIQMLRIFI
jgi:hypothetical protein